MDVVGAVTTVAVYPSMHLGVGAAMASAAMNMMMVVSFGLFTYLSWFDSELDDEDDDAEPQRPFPPPDFLVAASYRGTVNVACIGHPRSGKSSLINALRGLRPGDPEAAPVGLRQTTAGPAAYCLPLEGDSAGRTLPEGVVGCAWETDAGGESGRGSSPAQIRVWDMPATPAGASLQGERCQELGLLYFDAVLIVYAERISTAELDWARELEEAHKVPHFLVRSQVDVDIANEREDHRQGEEDTLLKLRAEAAAEGAASVYLVSAREPEAHDLPHLVTSLRTLAKARRRALLGTECPVCFEDLRGGPLACCACHWCGNAVCGRCARRLRGRHGEAMCPFCRRWTHLYKPPARADA